MTAAAGWGADPGEDPGAAADDVAGVADEDVADVGDVGQVARGVLRAAGAAGATIAVAESLTGGQVAAALTAQGGASAVFRGSVTAYATDLKASLLGVDAELLAEFGPVHGEVARQMASGVRRLCRADIGIATTGVAGPKAQDGKPVGTVFVAVASAVEAWPLALRLNGDRGRIQRLATWFALDLARRRLETWTRS
jgi:nicotinamide-nucleotide amidase